MISRSAEQQIHELAQGLAPVRPIPPLRAVFAAAVVLGLGALGVEWLLGGPGLRPAGVVASRLPHLATFTGLAFLALGALGAAFAAAVPGREASARLGARVACVGLASAVAGALWGIAVGGPPAAGEGVASFLPCIGRALALGAAPALLACAFIAHAAVWRPGLEAALALAGGVALGAVAVHATCPSDSATHWLLSHTLVPLAAGLLLAAPLAALLARRVRRR